MEWGTRYPSPLGELILRANEQGLTVLALPGQKYREIHLSEPARTGPPGEEPDSLRLARRWLDAYFAGQAPDPAALPLAPVGTPFRRRVWRALLDIPYGRTVTYGALAAALGTSPRAVGTAVGRNPISILIPCHRVVGADGSLTGYAGGLAAKGFLLALEGVLSPSGEGRER